MTSSNTINVDRRLQSARAETTISFNPLLAEDAEEGPKDVLHRLLSARSVVSTSATTQVELRLYQIIGRGSCGIVFEHAGWPHVVKRAHDGNEELWNDACIHSAVQKAFTTAISTGVRIPTCHGFICADNSEWWLSNAPQFPEPYQIPGDVLVTERILPLPKIIREALIDLCFPPSLPTSLREEAKESPGNKACLARVYLGKRRDLGWRPSLFFTLQNFNLHLDQMEELDLDVRTFATEMADALAVMHWVAEIDADDVEFVLGNAPTRLDAVIPDFKELVQMPGRTSTMGQANFEQRSIHLWVLDFNRCHKISMDVVGIESAVKAFFRNDPYYPRPLGKEENDLALWEIFETRYMMTSKAVGKGALAETFIAKVVETRKASLSAREKGETKE